MTDPRSRAAAELAIDLDAIVANWRLCRQRLTAGARCAAVVKADAYGLGAARVAPALARAGCQRFFVATIDEGIDLRRCLPESEILVLNGPLPGTEEDFLAFRLVPVLNSLEQAVAWAGFCTATGSRLPAALHIDTAMSRLGLHLYDAWQLTNNPAALGAFDLILVMTHLACADDPGHPYNQEQLAAFTAARSLFPGVEASIAASFGMFLGPQWHADWVRPGAALYGISPVTGGPNPTAGVVTLKARILQVRKVDAGDTVGYGATHSITEDGRRLATAGVGYADGIFRSLSNRGCGYLGEIRVPLVGRVSMDLIVFDVSDVPAEQARPGDAIEIIGPHNPVDEVARAADTIGYEILTALGHRYHRIYLGGGGE
jgi:alanine racemase